MKKKSSKKKPDLHPQTPTNPPEVLELKDTDKPSLYDLVTHIGDAKENPLDFNTQRLALIARLELKEVTRAFEKLMKSEILPLEHDLSIFLKNILSHPDRVIHKDLYKLVQLVEASSHGVKSEQYNNLSKLIKKILLEIDSKKSKSESAIPLVDCEKFTVTLEGQLYALTKRRAEILQMLINAKGGWVSSEELKEYRHSNERPDKMIKKLPPQILKLIESQRGVGFRLKITPK